MTSFAERTGLASNLPERRYLWTDAFAVCNFLGLGRATGEARYGDLALGLVDRVHHTLGRHRSDDARTGWISGLDEEHGEAHPTLGGLRIGKKYPERAARESFDEVLEWERDGQYFHYLTKWMHTLDQVTRWTKMPVFNLWGRELAEKAARAFCHTIGGPRRRMYWKMSIDLSRPLVTSMGQHDPLDGYVTCAELRATSSKLPGSLPKPSLDEEVAVFGNMMRGHELATADPLGIGGLLVDACRVDQLEGQGGLRPSGLCDSLLEAALSGLQRYAACADVERPAEHRLAFRELGLCIGLDAVTIMERATRERSTRDAGRRGLFESLRRFERLRTRMLSFWMQPEHRTGGTWVEHQDISDVMLATALAPDGFLGVPS